MEVWIINTAKGTIVAIGGGELRYDETKAMDEYIVKLVEKQTPKLLFIPTASHDAEGYIKLMDLYFGALGCVVTSLCLYNDFYSFQEMRQMILEADIIYVGGGDTV